MANGITFDKLEYVERLQASGFSEPQAKGAAEALDVALKDTVATKHDINEVKHEVQLTRRDLKIWTGGVAFAFFAATATFITLAFTLFGPISGQ